MVVDDEVRPRGRDVRDGLITSSSCAGLSRASGRFEGLEQSCSASARSWGASLTRSFKTQGHDDSFGGYYYNFSRISRNNLQVKDLSFFSVISKIEPVTGLGS